MHHHPDIIVSIALSISGIVIILMHYFPAIQGGTDPKKKLFPKIYVKYGKYLPILGVIVLLCGILHFFLD
jgi:hypothetical protein